LDGCPEIVGLLVQTVIAFVSVSVALGLAPQVFPVYAINEMLYTPAVEGAVMENDSVAVSLAWSVVLTQTAL
jgi:hypothetical protein